MHSLSMAGMEVALWATRQAKIRLNVICVMAVSIALGMSVTTDASAESLEFVNLSDPVAFGIPTVEIYVDGPFGGQLDWHNTGVDQPVPADACGFRVDGPNLLAWVWYEGGVSGVEFMDIPNNGDELPSEPGVWIEFTGPYGDHCADSWVFHTPATPGAEPPLGAVKLVIQFLDWHDIEFLNAGFQVMPSEDPWGPDPEPVDPCEVREFCEPPEPASDDLQLVIHPLFQ
jgi:hypothetical protein